MGCDIHVHVEVRRNGEWRHVGSDDAPDDHPLRKEYVDGSGAYIDWPKELPWEQRRHEFYGIGGRDYELFTALASVREYAKGIERVTPDAPRGLPRNVSELTLRYYKSIGHNAHTPSHATLAELLRYAAACGEYRRRGLVSVSEYVMNVVYGIDPKWWCHGTSSDIVSHDEAMAMYNCGTHVASNACVQHEWGVGAASFGDEFFQCCREELTKLDSDHNNVRIVFWFDN